MRKYWAEPGGDSFPDFPLRANSIFVATSSKPVTSQHASSSSPYEFHLTERSKTRKEASKGHNKSSHSYSYLGFSTRKQVTIKDQIKCVLILCMGVINVYS